jgi:flagellar biosynthesis protein FliQ
MGFDMNVEFLRMAFWQIVMVAGPVLLVALGIGLFIGIIQHDLAFGQAVEIYTLLTIGDGLVANQLTGTISGRSFDQSIINKVNPLIIALG